MSHEIYEGWRDYADEMDAYWDAREKLARRALEVVDERDGHTFRFAAAYAEICRRERRMNRRLQLLMLLRSQARQ